MAERRLVVDHLKLKYEGLFNLTELYNLISTWFYDKGWDWYERINQELITEEGKQVRIILEPWKNVSDYYKLAVSIKLHFTDVQDVEVNFQGRDLRLNKGLIHITFDGYVISDRKGQWQDSVFKWFLSIIADKYFFRNHFSKFEAWIKSDVEDLHDKIKSYLNLFGYSYRK